MEQVKNILLITLFLITTTLVSQECGNGTSEVLFYSRNGSKHTISYKVLNIAEQNTLKILKETNPFGNYDLKRLNHNGIIITEDQIKRLKTTEFKKFPFKTANTSSGKVVNGKIVFETKELHYKPVLLKIKTDSYSFYIWVNLFGGCNRIIRVLLEEKPRLVRRMY